MDAQGAHAEGTDGGESGERTRVGFRVTDEMKEAMMSAVEPLGIRSIGMAGRHLMLIGLQVVQAQQGPRAIQAQSAMMGELLGRICAIGSAENEGLPSILDTKAISPDWRKGKNGLG